jgi:hypothetical protein
MDLVRNGPRKEISHTGWLPSTNPDGKPFFKNASNRVKSDQDNHVPSAPLRGTGV